MSHFSVAIFHEPTDNIEEILAPYAEDVDENFPGAEQEEDYWFNPNARWDWWEVGGRWNGFLMLKNGTKRNSAPASECVFDIDQEKYLEGLKFWDIAMGNREPEDYAEHIIRYNAKYYQQKYRNKEDFAKDYASPVTYAYISHDGEWCEPSEMGWWGMNNSTRESYSVYLKKWEAEVKYAIDNNLMITVVDCHI